MRLCSLAAALVLTSVPVCALAQTAEVTFYSHGSWASEPHPFSRNGIFSGGVWDGDDPLFLFTDRPFKVNDRYVILNLPAGVHVFGTGEGRHPRKSSQMNVSLEAGKRYFVRARVKTDVLDAAVEFLELVPCSTAERELATATALNPRAVQRDKRTWIKPDQAVEPCR